MKELNTLCLALSKMRGFASTTVLQLAGNSSRERQHFTGKKLNSITFLGCDMGQEESQSCTKHLQAHGTAWETQVSR